MHSKVARFCVFSYFCKQNDCNMHRSRLLFIFFLFSATMLADNQKLLEELDIVIDQRSQYIQSKESKIDVLKKLLIGKRDNTAKLKILDDLYKEYYVFKFDSAMAYANKGLLMANLQKDNHYITLFTIHLAEILTLGGLYSEAINYLDGIDHTDIGQDLLFKYHYTYFSVYSYWSDYCNDQVFTPLYRQKANDFLKKAMQYANEKDPLYLFYLGEQMVYVEPNSKKAKEFYLDILKTNSESSRIYAMSSYALAGNYMVNGEEDKYEEYLIRAATSDIRSCTMENLALQTLAVYLYQRGEDNIERAEKYINHSMEDAKFYNNRLRILEISRNLPQIMNAYQATMEKQNQNLRYSILFISLLVVALFVTVFFIHRQNRKLTSRRIELAENNQQLTSLNRKLAESSQHQTDLNIQLQELNQLLMDTNKHREGLASIYIDLCAKYIDKLNKYQTLVKRKIKANQAQELLQTISSVRISQEDAATFLNRFDKAFLELYPTFVEEFNALLRNDGQLLQKSPHSLTTELRTFALIRLGVNNTADIAGLLFLSNQTIYNCRSTIKNRAIRKETFDDDVMHLCTVIK